MKNQKKINFNEQMKLRKRSNVNPDLKKRVFPGGQMDKNTIFLFGEAERGEYCRPIHCSSLAQFFDLCGNPPEGSEAVSYGVQLLLYEQPLVFFRIKQEGYSTADYLQGLKLLYKDQLLFPLCALCMPGVGDSTLIDAAATVCNMHHLILIVGEKDLYDYLTLR